MRRATRRRSTAAPPPPGGTSGRVLQILGKRKKILKYFEDFIKKKIILKNYKKFEDLMSENRIKT
jgi:hypothetical protein